MLQLSNLTPSSFICTDGSHNIVACSTQTGGNGSGADQTVTYAPGQISAVNATIGAFATIPRASTVQNIVGSAITFNCASNPTITMHECGTSSTCAAPTTIGTVTLTASGTRFNGTVSNSAVTAGDFAAWAMTSGTCASIDLAVNADVRAN